MLIKENLQPGEISVVPNRNFHVWQIRPINHCRRPTLTHRRSLMHPKENSFTTRYTTNTISPIVILVQLASTFASLDLDTFDLQNCIQSLLAKLTSKQNLNLQNLNFKF